METLSDRARERVKWMADQIENALKDIACNASMAARTITKFVRGVLNGQHRP
jgi:hypothetical protein